MKATFLSRFTPSTMAPEALEAIFVQREKLAQRLVELIRESALTPAKHQTLLIGPRGIGKTHVVSLVYHRLRAMDDLRDRLLVAWLREEEWGVSSFLDLLLRIFRALIAEYRDDTLCERVEALYGQPATAERAAAQLLKEFVGDRTLLVLVENLDDLFEGLGDVGQKQLRAYLQEHPFCTLLATAPSLFNGVSLQTSPFYGFFRIHHLQELDLEDAINLLAKIADREGDQELLAFIRTPVGRARVRTIHHLAGGNPRVYVIFAQFLSRESLDALVEPVMRTLDDLTPYYQARMAWLSPQQRKIVEFLCDRRHAVPVKEIARRCFITHQTTSSQLKDLREKGYFRSIPVGRESYYELREPLMRLCLEVKKHRGKPIRLFIDFLRLWYSRPELQQRLTDLASEASMECDYLLEALRLAERETDDPVVATCTQDLRSHLEAGQLTHALEVAEELTAIRGEWSDWMLQGWLLVMMDRGDEADVVLDRMETLVQVTFRQETPPTELVFATVGMLLLATATAVKMGPTPLVRLVRFFRKRQALSTLQLGLVGCAVVVGSLEAKVAAPKQWHDVWDTAGGQYPELQPSLHLLDVSIRYHETRDARVFLELPVEERRILLPLLNVEEPAGSRGQSS